MIVSLVGNSVVFFVSTYPKKFVFIGKHLAECAYTLAANALVRKTRKKRKDAVVVGQLRHIRIDLSQEG